MPGDTAISVSGLTKYYGELLAVDHISFNVGHGEFFGFLGPNGAGKTTTIRMLTNLTTPTEGSASILGFPVERRAIRLREQIGIIPEDPNVFDEFIIVVQHSRQQGHCFGKKPDDCRIVASFVALRHRSAA